LSDPQLRDFGTVTPGFARSEPMAPPVPLRSAASLSPVSAQVPAQTQDNGKIFASDALNGPDARGIETLLSLLAELTVHKGVELPLCIGILGGAGSGKSFTLARLAATVEALAAWAGAQNDTPYLGRLQIVQADAAHFDGEPMVAIAGALCTDLWSAAPDLVTEALRAARDPHAAVTEAAEKLDQAQRRLHQERDHLSEVEGRRARLFETVLYETPGSQVDAYARTFRPRIAARLQAFGFSGDPVLNYKDLVSSLATEQGTSGRVGLALRAVWAFKGQARLLFIALVLVLIGAGLGWAAAHQATWLSPMSANTTGAPVAAWFEAHMGAIAGLGKVAFAGAGLAVLTNLWRAFRFLQPILRGVTLLKTELNNRRHELDSAYAHQTRRVDGLNAEVERAARVHAEADQHAGKGGAQAADASPFQGNSDKAQAAQFVTTLASLVGQRQSNSQAPRGTPQRIVFMLDNLDAVPPARACDILDAAHRLLANQAFVTMIAVDPRRLADAEIGARTHLEKWVQVPVQIDATPKDHAAFILHLIGRKSLDEVTAKSQMPVLTGDARRSMLDQPLSEREGQLLAALAPLAGGSARSLKRFVNLYRLTRPLLADHWASLAFMLALESGGTKGEVEAITYALAVAKPGADLDLSQGHPRLNELLGVVRTLESGPTAEALRQAAVVAATFSFRA
jgi:hypothetical protein